MFFASSGVRSERTSTNAQRPIVGHRPGGKLGRAGRQEDVDRKLDDNRVDVLAKEGIDPGKQVECGTGGVVVCWLKSAIERSNSTRSKKERVLTRAGKDRDRTLRRDDRVVRCGIRNPLSGKPVHGRAVREGCRVSLARRFGCWRRGVVVKGRKDEIDRRRRRARRDRRRRTEAEAIEGVRLEG